ncbi:tyrosine-type recombinase/integrase [Acinetobacter radioresistens]|uniref:tyrosine-type recombinase/integrase n=1 Tax=Acinetobacter radioresistens TaxID=40216 RepID=UPI0021CE2AAB|nr:integrase arm-type DNA-binding domain-containing protein [Acinetobacter radioresistens]MCU4623452.1 tyrosine-type recombinase/integrase [Acinetobacter radioresistens]
MAAIKLSDAKIKTLKPEEKTYRILDGDRLYIEVRSTGAKVWRFKFVHEGKESSMSLGEYPAIGLADARSLRDEMKSKLARGIHPVKERKQAREEKTKKITNTFDAIAAEYLKERLVNTTERYREQFKDSLAKDISPVIGGKDVRDITSADVLNILKNTTARVRSQKNHGTGEVTAIQNRKFIGAVMRYAIATLRAENDPTYAVRDVIARPEVEHARPLSKEEKKKARTNLNTYRGTETVKNAGFILLYTMLRTIEIRRMQWSWVDFDERIINFPKSAMKKNREHILPMSDQVYEILQKQYLNSGNHDLVFPAIFKPQEMLGQMTLNRMLEYIGLKNVSAHDFRATASTSLYEKGYEEDWIEKQLAHANSNRTKASYDHSKHLDARRKMLQDWTDIVDSWAE